MRINISTHRSLLVSLLCIPILIFSACSKKTEEKTNDTETKTPDTLIRPDQKEVLEKKYESVCVQANEYLDLILEDHLDPKINASQKTPLLAMGLKLLDQRNELVKADKDLTALKEGPSLRSRRKAMNDEDYLKVAREFQNCESSENKMIGIYLKNYKEYRAKTYADILNLTLLGIDGHYSSFRPLSLEELDDAYAYGIDFQYLGHFGTAFPQKLRIKNIWNAHALSEEEKAQLFNAQVSHFMIAPKSEVFEDDAPWIPVDKFLKTHDISSSLYLDLHHNKWAAEKTALYIKGVLTDGTDFQLQLNSFEITEPESIPQAYGETLHFNDGEQLANYIHLKSFESKNAAENFQDTLKELSNGSTKNFILDLRGNGGGYMHQADTVLSHFFTEESTLYESFFPNRAFFKVFEANDQYLRFHSRTSKIFEKRTLDLDQEIKMIILVDNRSASASEITSAVLKHYNKAFVLGAETHTYGKFVGGFGHNVDWSTKDASIHLINSYFLLPNGTSHQGQPNIIDVSISHPFQTPKDELRNMNVDLSQFHFRDQPSIPRPEVAYKEELESRPDLTNLEEPGWISPKMYKQLKNADIVPPDSCMPEKWSEEVYGGDCVIDTALEYLKLMQTLRESDA